MHDSVLYTQYVQYIQSMLMFDVSPYVRSVEAPRAQPFSAEAVLRMAEEGQSQRAGRWLETLLNRGVLDSEPLRWEVEVALGQVFFCCKLEDGWEFRGYQIAHIEGIKECKCMVISSDWIWKVVSFGVKTFPGWTCYKSWWLYVIKVDLILQQEDRTWSESGHIWFLVLWSFVHSLPQWALRHPSTNIWSILQNEIVKRTSYGPQKVWQKHLNIC